MQIQVTIDEKIIQYLKERGYQPTGEFRRTRGTDQAVYVAPFRGGGCILCGDSGHEGLILERIKKEAGYIIRFTGDYGAPIKQRQRYWVAGCGIQGALYDACNDFSDKFSRPCTVETLWE